MSRNIIILNGSPRLRGNTAMLCDAFAKGAESAGHAVTRFDLQKMDIRDCLGCMKGGKDPASPCVQKDDMTKIYPAYMRADLVALASPMYYWSVSAQLKTAFVRRGGARSELRQSAQGMRAAHGRRRRHARQLETRAGSLPRPDRLSELDGSRTGAGRRCAGSRSRFRQTCS